MQLGSIMCHNQISLFLAGFLSWSRLLEELGRSHETGKENANLRKRGRKSNWLDMMDTFYKRNQTKGQIHGTNKAYNFYGPQKNYGPAITESRSEPQRNTEDSRKQKRSNSYQNSPDVHRLKYRRLSKCHSKFDTVFRGSL